MQVLAQRERRFDRRNKFYRQSKTSKRMLKHNVEK